MNKWSKIIYSALFSPDTKNDENSATSANNRDNQNVINQMDEDLENWCLAGRYK